MLINLECLLVPVQQGLEPWSVGWTATVKCAAEGLIAKTAKGKEMVFLHSGDISVRQVKSSHTFNLLFNSSSPPCASSL